MQGEAQGTAEAAAEVAPHPRGFSRARRDSVNTYFGLKWGELGTLRFCHFPPLGPAQAARFFLHTDLICSDQVPEMLPHKSILLAVKNEPNELH